MSAGGSLPRPRPPPPPPGPPPRAVMTWPPIIATLGSAPRPRAASPSPLPRAPPAPRPAPSDALAFAGLSAAQNLSSTGFQGEPVRFAATPRGGPVVVGPFSANLITGG